MSVETEEYVRLTVRAFAGTETPDGLARREELAQAWPLELIDTLDEAARRRAEQEEIA